MSASPSAPPPIGHDGASFLRAVRAGLDVEALEQWCPVPKVADFTATAALVLRFWLGTDAPDRTTAKN